jgi:hypothetical protein
MRTVEVKDGEVVEVVQNEIMADINAVQGMLIPALGLACGAILASTDGPRLTATERGIRLVGVHHLQMSDWVGNA